MTNDLLTEVNNTDCSFAGVTYLAQKFSQTSDEILALFIDCDYSLSHTAELLEHTSAA